MQRFLRFRTLFWLSCNDGYCNSGYDMYIYRYLQSGVKMIW